MRRNHQQEEVFETPIDFLYHGVGIARGYVQEHRVLITRVTANYLIFVFLWTMWLLGVIGFEAATEYRSRAGEHYRADMERDFMRDRIWENFFISTWKAIWFPISFIGDLYPFILQLLYHAFHKI